MTADERNREYYFCHNKEWRNIWDSGKKLSYTV